MAEWARFWRKLRRGGEALVDPISWQASRRHRRPHYVTRRWDGGKRLTGAPKIAVLAHFSTQNRFADYFVYLLRAIDRAGFATVVVSNSPGLDLESVQSILPLCGRVLQRENVGYDFGAWRDAISHTPEIAGAEQLLILNDSVFGPLQDLGEILTRCNFDRAAVWGMTDSYDRKYHLQSFFMLLGKTALESEAFAKFWRNMRYADSKRLVIVKYEIGFSQALLRGGLRLRALYPYRQMSESVLSRALTKWDSENPGSHPRLDEDDESLRERLKLGRPLNPTHYFWKYLITELGFPFIKRELLEKNPVGIPLLVNWRLVIERTSDYPVELIEDYLSRGIR